VTGDPPVSEAVARFLIAVHEHPLVQDAACPWLRRPDPAACPECRALADALRVDGDGR
jgi:hypothetical protein